MLAYIIGYTVTILQFIVAFVFILIGYQMRGWGMAFVLGLILFTFYHVLTSWIIKKFYTYKY